MAAFEIEAWDDFIGIFKTSAVTHAGGIFGAGATTRFFGERRTTARVDRASKTWWSTISSCSKPVEVLEIRCNGHVENVPHVS